MPIREGRKALYPDNWPELRVAVLARAGYRCEGTPRFPYCRAHNYASHPITRSKVVLTIAHMNHDEACADLSQLRALCQKCHLCYDASHHAKNAAATRRARKAICDFFCDAVGAGARTIAVTHCNASKQDGK